MSLWRGWGTHYFGSSCGMTSLQDTSLCDMGRQRSRAEPVPPSQRLSCPGVQRLLCLGREAALIPEHSIAVCALAPHCSVLGGWSWNFLWKSLEKASRLLGQSSGKEKELEAERQHGGSNGKPESSRGSEAVVEADLAELRQNETRCITAVL